MIRAWHADGSTFYYPLVAFVVGTVLAALVMGVAMGIVQLGLRLHGTDEERRRDDKGKQPRDAGGSAEPEVRPVAEPVETATTSAPPRVLGFETTHEFRDGSPFVELGIERETGRRYLKTPMSQRNGEWEEYYGIDLPEYETFAADATEAHGFATECRRQEHPDRWLFWPGARAPDPITIDRTRLAKKRAILLTDHPTNSSSVPVEGLPVGTPFVQIVGSAVDLDGNVQARLPAVDSPIVSIAADQLGL
ncbi:hypothetical protein [Mycobacterium sp. AZCC_0083]|uniref:hypothetical protein n=1 Tax=Mycobacterium sp. AZCC_0083 TaxID=2735882 RepID=UPI001611BD50|nr:hypothetical protein [Mycobacterium sp. AZCC_0083]MBB5163231.1 hypothetical protein [Mycobacterium sp. AZCC_0083]